MVLPTATDESAFEVVDHGMAETSIEEEVEFPLLILQFVVKTECQFRCALADDHTILFWCNLTVVVHILHLDVAGLLSILGGLSFFVRLPNSYFIIVIVHLCRLSDKPAVQFVVLIAVDADNLFLGMSKRQVGIPLKVFLVEDNTCDGYIDTHSLCLTDIADDLVEARMSREQHWEQQIVGPCLVEVDGSIEAVVEHAIVDTEVEHAGLLPLQLLVG